MIERKAIIFNIQKYNTHDGNGVRTLVFFKGCPLRCKWCSNPEGQVRQFQILYKYQLCVNCGKCVQVCPVGIHRMSYENGIHQVARDIECVGCRKCEQVCLATALSVTGELKSISELMTVIEEDRPFYDISGGGVTLGGGEPLLQPEVAANLLMVCKQRNINTAIETCGYSNSRVLKDVAEFTDLFLFDVKHMDSERHYALTGVHNETILDNLIMLFENRKNVRIRFPILARINDGLDNLSALVNFLSPFKDLKNFMGIDILPYHKLGVNKYVQIGLTYDFKDEYKHYIAELESVASYFNRHDIAANVLRH